MYDKEKTLFVTDLDGTLLRSDAALSDFTLRTVNELLSRRVKLAFATARSLHTAMKVVGEVDSKIPLILHNGAFIQKKSGEYLYKSVFTPEDISRAREALERFAVEPIVYSIRAGREVYSYVPKRLTDEERRFLDSRKGDPRDNPTDLESLWLGEIFYISCIGKEEALRPAFEAAQGFTRIFQPDFYSKDHWLELLPSGSDKASATLRLAELLGCERIVVFGDGANDLSMFRIADESCAVANAVPELRAAATRIIGSNDRDGVAKYLSENLL